MTKGVESMTDMGLLYEPAANKDSWISSDLDIQLYSQRI